MHVLKVQLIFKNAQEESLAATFKMLTGIMGMIEGLNFIKAAARKVIPTA